MAGGKDLAGAVSAYGAATKRKLSNIAIGGAPEDQLRAPLEALLHDLADLADVPRSVVTFVGETMLSHLSTRPDYAVTVHNALIGFIEVKAPGKGADPRRFTDDHDKKQWDKLMSLPNLLYTDGNSFSHWSNGALQGKIVHLEGDVESSGTALAAPATLLPIISDFLRWKPTAPRNAKQLASTSARLCRLLRDEVTEELERNNPGLTSLAGEWRNLLFPEANNQQFADGYAQAVTFGLLVARVRGIPLGNGLDFAKGLDAAANELRKTSTLIGSALRLLIDNPDIKTALKTSLGTLSRVLNEVDWQRVTKGNPDAWLYFYEDFLADYDNTLRKKTGSYYTPPEVVTAMVRLTNEALSDPALFNRRGGLAASSVTICDPAVGTGTFLLGVLRQIAQTVEQDQGAGAVGPAITSAVDRILGFELQFGPFAVAQLRLIAEMQSLVGTGTQVPSAKLYVTDTLGDPYATETQFSALVAPIGESRKEANRIKRESPITVVIGNPPYKNQAGGLGGWVEMGTAGREAPMDRWNPPREWGVGAHSKHLKNLYIYFWRWATWKVFGSGVAATTGLPDVDRSGIVCFITVAGFLNGPGFQKMREDLRRDCTAIWVIDCSPEGHQPEVSSRIFEGVQQAICIVLAARTPGKDRSTAAALHFVPLPEGHRVRDKFPALAALSLNGTNWRDGPSGWREPFLPEQQASWGSFPALEALFDYNGSGVMPGRTWVVAPDSVTLTTRWDKLVREKDSSKKELLFHPHLRNGAPGDKHTQKTVSRHLTGHPASLYAVAQETGSVSAPTRYAFRSFDRQWIIPDARVINQPNPTLWDTYSGNQIFLTAPEDRTPVNGPSLSICGLIPDLHHYHGRGGRVYPLWRNAQATVSNIKPALLTSLATLLGRAVSPEDVIAYIAAVMAHPAFTARFQTDLVRPGLRLPVTANADLFGQAVAVGREVIWLHTYGERFANPKEGRPAGPPRLSKADAPTVPKGGTIPGAPEPLPDEMSYEEAAKRLRIGRGYIDNVPLSVWAYEVSGMNVLRQWFSYRKRDRTRPIIGDRRKPSPLGDIQPEHWPHEYTTDLLDLLHVLGRLVALEPRQAELLDAILACPLLDKSTLSLETPPEASPNAG